MATQTLNASTNLTYEEIYEGYANGKSRLPKILKDIVAGTTPWSTLAGTTGIEILRRRTGGGNSTNVTGIGITVSTPVAMLISSARFDALLAGYNGPDVYDHPPSQNYIDTDVRGLAKNPFDLLDMVSGVNNTDNSNSTRAAKIIGRGSSSIVRDVTEVITDTTVNYNVRTKFNDRVGSGGATGEVHGVDQGIQEIVEAASEVAIAGAAYATSYNLTTDDELGGQIDNTGGGTAEFGATVVSVEMVLGQINAVMKPDSLGRDVAYVESGNLMIRSQSLEGAEVDITEANTPLGFAVQTAVGATVGGAAMEATGQEIIELSTGAVGYLTHIRYGTYQFGTLRVYNSINDTSPVAYVMHPDLLEDMITWNP